PRPPDRDRRCPPSSRCARRCRLDGHLENIVMAVPIRVVALAEELEVLLVAQLCAVEPVRGAELVSTRQIHGRFSLLPQTIDGEPATLRQPHPLQAGLAAMRASRGAE